MGKYFGTDGIRGVANLELTVETAKRCGNALTFLKKKPTVVVGRDTRVSGDMLSHAIFAGVTMGGGNVVDLGVVTTPCVAYLARRLGADYGVVISASHNPPQFNGIKVFGGDGYKIPDTDKQTIEDCIFFDRQNVAEPADIGRVTYRHDAIELYCDSIVEAGADLSGMKIAIDCSNGALYEMAPRILKRLGAEVVAIHTESDGVRVNVNCGALYPEEAAGLVKETGADMGFSFDGDADRIIAVDEKGNLVDGDAIIYIFAKNYLKKGELTGKKAVGTLHTNMGAEKKLKDIGVTLVRTDIGDQFVLEEMLREQLVVGGEQSGHIILTKHSTTGDGILTGVRLASLVREEGKPLSALNEVTPFPQENIGIIVQDKEHVLSHMSLQEAMAAARQELGDTGRILVRASGTEPKIRIMTECESAEKAKRIAKNLKKIVEQIVAEDNC